MNKTNIQEKDTKKNRQREALKNAFVTALVL